MSNEVKELLRRLADIGVRNPDGDFWGPDEENLIWKGIRAAETRVDFDWTVHRAGTELRTGVGTVRAYVVDKGVDVPELSATCTLDEDGKCVEGDYDELVQLVGSWVEMNGVPAHIEFARAADALKAAWRARLEESEARIDGQLQMVRDLLGDMANSLPRPTVCDSLASGVHVVQPSAVLSWHSDHVHVQLDIHCDGRVVVSMFGRTKDAGSGNLRLQSKIDRFVVKQRREIQERLLELLNDKNMQWR
jgi:hypothetical protein